MSSCEVTDSNSELNIVAATRPTLNRGTAMAVAPSKLESRLHAFQATIVVAAPATRPSMDLGLPWAIRCLPPSRPTTEANVSPIPGTKQLKSK